jgi:hypothetical protein
MSLAKWFVSLGYKSKDDYFVKYPELVEWIERTGVVVFDDNVTSYCDKFDDKLFMSAVASYLNSVMQCDIDEPIATIMSALVGVNFNERLRKMGAPPVSNVLALIRANTNAPEIVTNLSYCI